MWPFTGSILKITQNAGKKKSQLTSPVLINLQNKIKLKQLSCHGII